MANLEWAIGSKATAARGLSKRDQAERKIIWLPIKKVFDKTDRNFKLDVDHPTGGPNAIGNRVEKAKDFWAQGNAMEPPVIHYDPVFKRINFVDGRHRLVAAYQLGDKNAPFLVVPEEYDNIKSLMETIGVDQEDLLKKFPMLNKTEDIDKVAIWLKSKPEDLHFIIKYEPIEKFAKDKKRLEGIDAFPEDVKKIKRINRELIKSGKILPIFVELNDPDLFIMEGRHRILSFWMTGQKTVPVVYVNKRKELRELRQGEKDLKSVDLDQFLFAAEFEFVVPVYGSDSHSSVADSIKAELQSLLNISEFGDSYASVVTKDQSKNSFRLTSDTTVKSDKFDDYIGMEFIIPALEYNRFIDIVEKTLEYIEKNDFETNGTTGLHVNMSFKEEGKNAEIDQLKLVVLSGDEYLRKTWPRIQYKLDSGRKSPDFIKSNIKSIQNVLHEIVFYNQSKSKEAEKDLINTIKQWLNSSYQNELMKMGPPTWKLKHHAVNIGKLDSSGYVEFRALGGAGYEKRFNEINNQIKRFALLMDVSSSETDRKTYLKKLYKLLSNSLEKLEDSLYDSDKGELVSFPVKGSIKNPKALQILTKADLAFKDNPLLRSKVYSFASLSERGDKGAALNYLFDIMPGLLKDNKQLSGTMRSIIVMLFRTYRFTKKDVVDFYESHYYHKSNPPEQEYDEEENEYYYPEDVYEYELTLEQVLKILGF